MKHESMHYWTRGAPRDASGVPGNIDDMSELLLSYIEFESVQYEMMDV